jgi:hypothetical protein
MVNLPLPSIGGVIDVYLAGGGLSVASPGRLHHVVRHRDAQRHTWW